jgi:hypothetical protein
MDNMIEAVKIFIKDAVRGYKEENEDFKRHDWVMDEYPS